MNDFVMENAVSNSGQLPQMDLSIGAGKGYDPVCELMRAIVLRVIEDYSSSGEFRQEAIDYMSDEDDDYIFSFPAICKHLGLDPQKTKYAIMNATHRISTRRRSA